MILICHWRLRMLADYLSEPLTYPALLTYWIAILTRGQYMKGIDSTHLRQYIVKPALMGMHKWSQEAEDLIMGTIAIESTNGRYLRQLGNKYARGLCQIEPPTFNWLAFTWLVRYPELYTAIKKTAGIDSFKLEYLEFNLIFSVCMARCKYLTIKSSIPADLAGQARYWKKYYNGNAVNGLGVEDYIRINR